MANHLSMANIQAIAALHRSGHSNRHTARVLGINRETVGKYSTRLADEVDSRNADIRSPALTIHCLEIP
ncbi:hypothetical protein [Rhodopirellula europaea]|uniref:hypothetical protein n=1 Tax=Rhodopirellula europaea TaxID=1263866 RepID=UPI003D27A5C6